MGSGFDPLLWVIRRVREDTRVEPTLTTIIAGHDDPMTVRLHELIIQYMTPLGMEELSLTMRQESLVNSRFACIRHEKVLEVIRKL